MSTRDAPMTHRLRALAHRFIPGTLLRVLGRLERVARRIVGRLTSPMATTADDVAEPPSLRAVEVAPIAAALWDDSDRDDSDQSARERLREIEAADDVMTADRLRASLALARFFAVNDPLVALDHLAAASALRETFDAGAVILEADCLYMLDRAGEARRLLATVPPEPETTIRIGRARAAQHDLADHGSGPMIEALTEVYGNANVTMVVRDRVHEPVSVFNLRAASSRRDPTDDTPTVSVVLAVDVANDPSLATLSSLLAQSWRPLEIVAVIDESDSLGRDRVEALCATAEDDRLDVVLAMHSRDLHRAQRYALGLARSSGQLVAFHDAVEWSHPLRIEAEASHLCHDRALAAAGSHHCVVDDDLLPVQPPWPGDSRMILEYLGGVMFRRPVAEALLSADGSGIADAAERLRLVAAAHGDSALVWTDPGVPLALTLGGDTHDRRDHRIRAA